MHPLERFTRKSEPELRSASTTPTAFRGTVLAAGTPVTLPPWVRNTLPPPEEVSEFAPAASAPPPLPPPPSPEQIAAPFKAKIAALEQQLAAERTRIVEVAQKVDADLVQFESTARALIVDMALVAARVFVGEAAPVEAVRNAVGKALESLPLTPGMTLHVAGANAEALKEHVPATLKIAVDPNLKPGDCRLESDSGGVDGRLEVRAHELRQRLLAALLDGRGDGE
jgi:hypothetical protein